MSLTSEDTVQRHFAYEWASGVLVPILSVVLAVILGGIVVLSAGDNPLTAYGQLMAGAFGGPYNISETLVAAIPLMLTGLSVAFAFRAGLFNIGAQGQLIIGGVASAWVGYKLNLPAIILVPLAIVAGAVGGAVWGGIAGTLKAWRGAHEVITTMMLNYVALYVSLYLLESTPSGTAGPMEQTVQPGFPGTPPMNASLPNIIPQSLISSGRLHAGLLVALAMAGLFWFVMWRTTAGYKIRAVGLSPKAAAYAGINVSWNVVLAMLIAGAFAGLAGMVQIFGLPPYQLTAEFSASYGFDAIAVALLGRNTPIGVIAAAILFGALDHGGALMQSNANISSHLIEIIQGLIIFFIAADSVVRWLARRGTIRLPRYQKQEATA